MLILYRVTVACQEVLEQSAETFSSRVFVNFEMIEVSTGSSIPLIKVAILVLDRALRSHSHLYASTKMKEIINYLVIL